MNLKGIVLWVTHLTRPNNYWYLEIRDSIESYGLKTLHVTKLVNVGCDTHVGRYTCCQLAQEAEYNRKIFQQLLLFKDFWTKNLAIIIGLSVRFYRR